MAVAAIEIVSKDLERLEKSLANLPANIRHKVMRSVLGRVQTTMKTRVARHASQRTKLAQALFKDGLRVRYGDTDLTLDVKTKWPTRLEQLIGGGRAPSAARVYGQMRKAYKGAFIATMKSGHAGLFMRTGKGEAADRGAVRRQRRRAHHAQPR